MDNKSTLSKHSSYERGRRNRHALGGLGYRRSLEGWADRAGPPSRPNGRRRAGGSGVCLSVCDGAERLKRNYSAREWA
jgi:hypothetical protein